VAICVIWGTTYLGIRICLETGPPALMAGLRWLAAGAALALLQRARGEPLPPRSSWPALAGIGALLIVGGNGLVVWAEQWVPSGLTSVLLATTPFWMLGVEAVARDGERPRGREWLGLVIGFAGIVLLVWPELTTGGQPGRRFVAGVVGLQGACLTWSVASAVERRQLQAAQHRLGAAAVEMIFGGIILTALGTLTGDWSRIGFSARSAAAFAYLVVVGSIIGYSAYLHVLKHLSVSTISLYSYINPIIAVALGTLVAGEAFGARSAAASALVLLGVTVVRWTAGGTMGDPVRATCAERMATTATPQNGGQS
jgi:drug/metabolite transporter (DMT)-like permease